MWRAQFLICQKDDQSPFITLLGAAAASARGAERSPPELEHLAVEHDLGVIPAGVRHAELPLFFVANSEQHVLSFERVGLWRLADVFDAAGVKATVALNSQSARSSPRQSRKLRSASSTAASSAAAESARPQHPPTAVMNQAAQAGRPSSQTPESAREQHPPTAAMNQATQGGAASPQDVQSQIRGGPTAVEQAEGARRPASEHLASAQAALQEARGFDR